MKHKYIMLCALALLLLLGCVMEEKPIEGVVVEKTSHYTPHRMMYSGKHWIHYPGYWSYRLKIRTDSTTESRSVSENVYKTIQIGDSIKL